MVLYLKIKEPLFPLGEQFPVEIYSEKTADFKSDWRSDCDNNSAIFS